MGDEPFAGAVAPVGDGMPDAAAGGVGGEDTALDGQGSHFGRHGVFEGIGSDENDHG